MKFLLLMMGLLFSMELSAGVYKCIDASGNKIYRSNPCTQDQSRAELNLKTGGAKDLDAIEKQKQQEQSEQQAQEAEKQRQQQELAQKQSEFKQRAIEESSKNQELIKNNPKRYSAFAIPPYNLDNLPELVKRFEQRLPDIERMRREAAEKALATNECGRVESVELNQKSIEKSLVILVDCSTAKKFYFPEQDLAAAAPVESPPQTEAVPAAHASP